MSVFDSGNVVGLSCEWRKGSPIFYYHEKRERVEFALMDDLPTADGHYYGRLDYEQHDRLFYHPLFMAKLEALECIEWCRTHGVSLFNPHSIWVDQNRIAFNPAIFLYWKFSGRARVLSTLEDIHVHDRFFNCSTEERLMAVNWDEYFDESVDSGQLIQQLESVFFTVLLAVGIADVPFQLRVNSTNGRVCYPVLLSSSIDTDSHLRSVWVANLPLERLVGLSLNPLEIGGAESIIPLHVWRRVTEKDSAIAVLDEIARAPTEWVNQWIQIPDASIDLSAYRHGVLTAFTRLVRMQTGKYRELKSIEWGSGDSITALSSYFNPYSGTAQADYYSAGLYCVALGSWVTGLYYDFALQSIVCDSGISDLPF